MCIRDSGIAVRYVDSFPPHPVRGSIPAIKQKTSSKGYPSSESQPTFLFSSRRDASPQISLSLSPRLTPSSTLPSKAPRSNSNGACGNPTHLGNEGEESCNMPSLHARSESLRNACVDTTSTCTLDFRGESHPTFGLAPAGLSSLVATLPPAPAAAAAAAAALSAATGILDGVP